MKREYTIRRGSSMSASMVASLAMRAVIGTTAARTRQGRRATNGPTSIVTGDISNSCRWHRIFKAMNGFGEDHILLIDVGTASRRAPRLAAGRRSRRCLRGGSHRDRRVGLHHEPMRARRIAQDARRAPDTWIPPPPPGFPYLCRRAASTSPPRPTCTHACIEAIPATYGVQLPSDACDLTAPQVGELAGTLCVVATVDLSS